ncbi:MAG TPA: endo-1,3-alpha-glucanase family glycosylhydrolase [Armatimonadota bacterium]
MRSFCFATFLLVFLMVIVPLAPVHADAPGTGPYLVMAHYMPCFPPMGINPDNPYWYAAQSAPWSTARTAVPSQFCTDLTASDKTLLSYINEIKLAKSYGIDGFFVDELWDSTGYRATWTNLLKAAEIVGGFSIGLMPDYACLADGNTDFGFETKQQMIKAWIDLAGNSPALLRYNSLPCVVPYGVGYPDGNGAAPAEKTSLVDWMASQGKPISYMATHGLDWSLYTLPYAKDPSTGFQTFAFGTGSFCPLADTTLRQRALDYWPSTFMQMAENSFLYQNPGALWYLDAHQSQWWRDKWAWNISHRDRYRWCQIITWNDWGESGICPSANHFMAWQAITKYYTEWFKTGVQPTITQDSITILHRPHAANAVPSPYTNNYIPNLTTASEVEALALLTAPSTIYIQTGTNVYSASVPAGLQTLTQIFQPGVQKAWIVRGTTTIASVTSPVPIFTNPARQNLWYIGATSLYPPDSLALANWTMLSGTMTGSNATRSGTGISLVGNGTQLINYRLSATVTPTTAGSSDSSAGLILRAQSSSYFRFAIGQWSGSTGWRLSRFDNGAETVLASGPTTYQAGVARTLRFDCVGEYLVAYLDGTYIKVLSDWGTPNKPWTDNRWAYGQAGVSAVGASTSFTNILLERYDIDASRVVSGLPIGDSTLPYELKCDGNLTNSGTLGGSGMIVAGPAGGADALSYATGTHGSTTCQSIQVQDTNQSNGSQGVALPSDNGLLNLGNPGAAKTLTITAWINPSTLTGTKGIVNRQNTAGQGWCFYLQDAQLVLTAGGTGGTSSTSAPAGTFTAGQWQFIAVVWDVTTPGMPGGNSITFYRNGVKLPVTGGAWPAPWPGMDLPAQGVEIARQNGLTGYNGFLGKMDYVRIYNRALLATDIATLYQNDQTLQYDVSGNGNLDNVGVRGGSGSIVAGPVGGADALSYATGSHTLATGQAIQVQDTNPSNGSQGAALPGDIGIFNLGNTGAAKTMTITAWINPSTLTGTKGIVNRQNLAGQGWCFYLQDTQLVLTAGTLGGQSATSAPAGTFTAGQWQFVAVVWDVTTPGTPAAHSIAFYRNGVKLPVTGGAYPAPWPGVDLPTQGVEIARQNGLNGYNGFLGKMDTVRVFNRALSATEIMNLSQNR